MAIKYISDGESPAQIRRRLRNVPEKLSEVYEHILEHVIDRDNRPRTLLLLQWVCLARQLLTVTGLRIVVAVTKAKTSPDRLCYQDTEDFVETDARMEKLIVNLSGGLMETIGNDGETESDDGETESDGGGMGTNVHVIHQSVNDFLVLHGLAILSSITGDIEKTHCHELLTSEPFHMVHRSHGVLLRGCLNYISSEEVQFEEDFSA